MVWCAGYQWDYVFDWTILKHQQSGSAPRAMAPPRPEAPADEENAAGEGAAYNNRCVDRSGLWLAM